MEHEEINGVKVEKLPTLGRPLSLKGSRWKPTLNVSDKDLKALKDTIKASEKKKDQKWSGRDE